VRPSLCARTLRFPCGCKIGARSQLRFFRFGGHVAVARLAHHFLCFSGLGGRLRRRTSSVPAPRVGVC